MPAKPAILNIIFTLLAGLGLLTALAGLGMDVLFGTYPGLNLPQLLLIVSGLLGSLTAFRLRRGNARQRVWAAIRDHRRALLIIIALTVIALELVLAAAGINTYYPPPPPARIQKRRSKRRHGGFVMNLAAALSRRRWPPPVKMAKWPAAIV